MKQQDIEVAFLDAQSDALKLSVTLQIAQWVGKNKLPPFELDLDWIKDDLVSAE